MKSSSRHRDPPTALLGVPTQSDRIEPSGGLLDERLVFSNGTERAGGKRLEIRPRRATGSAAADAMRQDAVLLVVVQAFGMTVAMVAWMRRRGHSWGEAVNAS